MKDKGYDVEWYIAQLKQDIKGLKEAYNQELKDNRIYMLNDVMKDIIDKILLEYNYARKNTPQYPDDIIHQIVIIGKMVKLCKKAALQLVYEDNSSGEEVYKEVIQIAAMCIRFLVNFKL